MQAQAEGRHRGARPGIDHDAHHRRCAGLLSRLGEHPRAGREEPGGLRDRHRLLAATLEKERQLLDAEAGILAPATEQGTLAQRLHQLLGSLDLQLVGDGSGATQGPAQIPQRDRKLGHRAEDGGGPEDCDEPQHQPHPISLGASNRHPRRRRAHARLPRQSGPGLSAPRSAPALTGGRRSRRCGTRSRPARRAARRPRRHARRPSPRPCRCRN